MDNLYWLCHTYIFSNSNRIFPAKMKIEISPLKIIFFVLLLFGIYLLINRMLGHSATLEIIVTILTGSMFAAILDLYKTNAFIQERLAKMEKDIEQIKGAVVKT